MHEERKNITVMKGKVHLCHLLWYGFIGKLHCGTMNGGYSVEDLSTHE